MNQDKVIVSLMNISLKRGLLKRIPYFSSLISILSKSFSPFSLVKIRNKLFNKKIALLYQEKPPPMRRGVLRPLKPGGYSDTSADIAYCLQQNKLTIITPKENPNVENDLDWVFPDSDDGIKDALKKGANILWLNTVLYEGHPIETYLNQGLEVVGQIPHRVELYDDKWVTNNYLRSYHIPIPQSLFINKRDLGPSLKVNLPFPVVLKPVRGRESKAVEVVKDLETLKIHLEKLLESKKFGDAVIVEEFLPGKEITITVMPPGSYVFNKKILFKGEYWCLPAIKRLNHEKDIAPFDGTVAALKNCTVMSNEELRNNKIKKIEEQSEFAAKMVSAKAPVQIDWRENVQNTYSLFDFNMKPNNNGPGRPHRLDQDSFIALAARNLDWSYPELLINCLFQSWVKPKS